MSSEKKTKIPHNGYADLDKGIADIIVELNKKGYKTICSCEGHLYEYTSKSWNYNYSPVWIVFESKYHLPPYPPQIEGYDIEMANPWRTKGGGYYLGEYEAFKGRYQYALWVGFSFYKRVIKQRGNIHKEHERVLDEILKWAKELPKRDSNLAPVQKAELKLFYMGFSSKIRDGKLLFADELYKIETEEDVKKICEIARGYY